MGGTAVGSLSSLSSPKSLSSLSSPNAVSKFRLCADIVTRDKRVFPVLVFGGVAGVVSTRCGQ
jgi:hypothetical protein